MQQRISVITIGADNLVAMRAFYENTLGWKAVTGNADIVFYRLNGFLLSICQNTMLADFIGIPPKGNGFRRTTIGYNVETEQEVLAIYTELKDKVKILKAPTAAPFGGLFFYFKDVEDNILEVACNPYVLLDENNNAIGHKPVDNLSV